MSQRNESTPTVMAISGLDSTGGAGLQADIETIASVGCHAAPVVTTITAQNTQCVFRCTPLDATLVIDQARAVLQDMPIAAFKLGLLGSVQIITAVRALLLEHPEAPMVLDPIVSSGTGQLLASEEVLDAMVSLLFPLTTVLTPNASEARVLAPEADSRDAMAQQIMSYGCEYVLITGADEKTEDVLNTLHTNRRRVQSFSWDRLTGSFHGSGCTLASAIAGLLAHGCEPRNAVSEAQSYAWAALQSGHRPGAGQHIPNRLFWASKSRGRKA